jgi:glucosamine--fructose-6-phosphate aminotransferase (isomerizing)
LPPHDTPQNATYPEILAQPVAWQEALQVVAQLSDELRRLWSQQAYDQVIFTGCGSTYYLALAAAALFQDLTGRPARGVPAGELVMYPNLAYAAGARVLLVAISRSAKTTETLRAVESFKQGREGEVIVVTNYGHRALAEMGALTIAIPEGQEQSVAQTRSFASMYVATTAMALVLSDHHHWLDEMRRLPEIGHQLLARYEELARSLGSDLDMDRFYFLGSGPRYGLACETNLKMKEMTLTHSEPFHFLEFRHGPKSMLKSWPWQRPTQTSPLTLVCQSPPGTSSICRCSS